MPFPFTNTKAGKPKALPPILLDGDAQVNQIGVQVVGDDGLDYTPRAQVNQIGVQVVGDDGLDYTPRAQVNQIGVQVVGDDDSFTPLP